MAKKRNSEDMSGSTFADLYDVQEELTRKGVKPMGRPKNAVERKPTTIYLTKEEAMLLRRLHLVMSDHVSSVNRSHIVGLAIETLAELVALHNEDDKMLDGVRSLEGVKRKLTDLMMS